MTLRPTPRDFFVVIALLGLILGTFFARMILGNEYSLPLMIVAIALLFIGLWRSGILKKGY